MKFYNKVPYLKETFGNDCRGHGPNRSLLGTENGTQIRIFWFHDNNLGKSLYIAIKLCINVLYHKILFGMDFRGYDPIGIVRRGQNQDFV